MGSRWAAAFNPHSWYLALFRILFPQMPDFVGFFLHPFLDYPFLLIDYQAFICIQNIDLADTKFKLSRFFYQSKQAFQLALMQIIKNFLS
jgi:hypothetical protein